MTTHYEVSADRLGSASPGAADRLGSASPGAADRLGSASPGAADRLGSASPGAGNEPRYPPAAELAGLEEVPAPGSASLALRPGLVADLITLTKPRITLMEVVTMVGGIWLAAHHVGASFTGSSLASSSLASSSLARLTAAVLGTALIVSSANALNMYLERDSDRFMDRTRNRPLPNGRLAPPLALYFGLALGAVSVPILTFAVNAVTGLLAAIALVSYVVVYTPLKRTTTASLLIGAVPGAMPPLLGWTAVTGRITLPGLLLFSVLFLWQIPHFLAIATFRRDDYVRAGLKILPAERGDRVTRVHIVGYLVALLAVTFALVPAGVGGRLYLASAIGLGAVFFGFGLWGLRQSAGVRWARGLFGISILYLVLLFGALMVSP